jgi:hypothetical protein
MRNSSAQNFRGEIPGATIGTTECRVTIAD